MTGSIAKDWMSAEYRSFPHQPSLYEFTRLRRHSAKVLTGFVDHAGTDYLHFSRHFLISAMLDYYFGAALDKVMTGILRAIQLFTIGVERSPDCPLVDMNRFLFAAIAMRDDSNAVFLSTVPDQRISQFPDVLKAQYDVVSRLLKRDERNLWLYAEILRDLSFMKPLTPEVRGQKPEVRNFCQLCEAVSEANEKEFLFKLADRAQIQAELLAGKYPDDPFDLIDFAGLALCRLGRDRGIVVNAGSPYLPEAFSTGSLNG